MDASLIFLAGAGGLFIVVRLVRRARPGDGLPTHYAALLTILAFTLPALLAAPDVRLSLDHVAPLCSLLLTNLCFTVGATAILFNVIYQRGWSMWAALRLSLTLGGSVGLGLGVLYLVEIIHLEPYDWTALDSVGPLRPQRLLFGLTMLSYVIGVGGIAIRHQWLQYRAEISPAVKGRVTVGLLSVGATTTFFMLLALKLLLDLAGLREVGSVVKGALSFCTLSALSTCMLWLVAPRELLAWPWLLRASAELAPLQQHSERGAAVRIGSGSRCGIAKVA